MGTADAIFQNLYTLDLDKPDEVLILAGDHIYKMNYGSMLDFHRGVDADLTVAVVEVAKDQANKALPNEAAMVKAQAFAAKNNPEGQQQPQPQQGM